MAGVFNCRSLLDARLLVTPCEKGYDGVVLCHFDVTHSAVGAVSGSIMKIAELEAHHEACVHAERTIRSMVERREFPGVFSVCIASFEHILPAIKCRKKRDITPHIPSIFAFTTISIYAPPLFEHSAIESLLEFVRSSRVLVQSEDSLLDVVGDAMKRELLAQKLWNHLDRNPGTLQRDVTTELGIAQEDATKVIEIWEELGIVDRKPDDGCYRLQFHTRIGMEAVGMCPKCGVRGKGRKELFFQPVTCQKCGITGQYHIDYPVDSGRSMGRA